MGKVEIRRTTALFPNAVFVQWDIDPDESGPLLVDIARSASPSGPWESVADSLLGAYNFLDDRFNVPPPTNDDVNGRENLNLFALSRAIYYQITVWQPSGAKLISDPTPVEPGLDRRTRLLKRKILRDQAVGYRRLNGIPIILLKRKRWGARCSDCYDPVTKQSTLEHCLMCFGTSYAGGYWTPTLIRGRREAAAIESHMESSGDSDTEIADFNILDYPLVEYKDIIVDLVRNDRYQVQRVHRTELKSVTVHQKITSSLLGRNSIEYNILVDPENTPPLY